MTEFPEQKVDTATLVEDVLKSTYFKLVGRDPDEGNFYPNQSVVDQLDAIFTDKQELIDFLKLSIALHIWMREQPNAEQVPFFVNRLLLAEKRVTLLDKYANLLRERYGSKIENVKSFSTEVYADVASVESDYWYLAAANFMHGETVQLEFLKPTVAWVLASALLRRFKGLEKRNGCPVIFASRAVVYDGRKIEFEAAWALEMKACGSSKKREDLLVERACEAINDIRTDWAIKTGLITPYKDEFDVQHYKNLSGLDMELLEVSDGDNLFEKDRGLLSFAKGWLTDVRGITFERSNSPRTVKMSEALEDEVEEPAYSDDFKLLSKKKLDPFLKSLVES